MNPNPVPVWNYSKSDFFCYENKMCMRQDRQLRVNAVFWHHFQLSVEFNAWEQWAQMQPYTNEKSRMSDVFMHRCWF